MHHDPIVEFDRITKIYPTGLLGRAESMRCRDVSLAVPAGSVFGLLGPNRAGKTTLVKILLSICHATRGSIKRLGRPGAIRSTLAQVGYLHESQAFPRYLTVPGLLEYYGALAESQRPICGSEFRDCWNASVWPIARASRSPVSARGWCSDWLWPKPW